MTFSHQFERRSSELSLPRIERLGAERNRDVERAADVDAEEARRRDADDRERHALDRQRSADDVGRAAEPALPEGVADDRHRAIRAAAAPVVVGRPRPSEDRLNAEHVEIASARPDAVDELGRSALREVEPRARPGEGAVEELRPVADGLPDRVGPRRSPLRQLAHHDEALRIAGPAATAAAGCRESRTSPCWRRFRAPATGSRRRRRWARLSWRGRHYGFRACCSSTGNGPLVGSHALITMRSWPCPIRT